MINIKTALKVLRGEYFLFVSGDGNLIKIDRQNANDIADLITRQQAVCDAAKKK